MALGPGSVVGGCLVEQVLGRGGMGVVLRARDGGPQGPPVAVKVMLAGFERDERKLRRFARELEATRALDHAGIVRVLRADVACAHPWIVMEYVDGPTLERVLADPRRTLAERLELLEQVCRAVHHAHERGILHRDLKPSNVLVGRDGRARVADFGLARDVSRETRLTETGSLLGTPAYVAPESIDGREATAASDVWALGVMLYEALTGRRPFVGGAPLEVVRRIMEETPRAPSRLSRALTAEHDRVALTAMAKDPAARPTALELARQVHALRTGRGARGARRRPWLVALPVVAVVVLAAAAVLALRPPPPGPPAPRPRPATTPAPPPHAPVVARPPPPPPPPADPLARARAALAAFDAAGAEAALEGLTESAEGLLLRARARDLALDFVNAGLDLEQAIARGRAAGEAAVVHEALLLAAAVRHGSGDPQGAYARLGEAIEADRRRYEAWTRRGLLALYGGQKDGPTCRGDLARALELAPRSSEALRNAAVLAWDDQEHAEAEELYARALAADPGDAEALDLRAWLHRDRGDAAAMRRDMAAALERFARLDDRAGHFVKVARAARERFEADVRREADGELALAAARRALGENIRHPLALQEQAIVVMVHGVARFEVGYRAGAGAQAEGALRQPLQALDWALSVNDGLAELSFRRAVLRTLPWSGRDPRGALADIERYLAVRPDDADGLRIRADLRRELGE